MAYYKKNESRITLSRSQKRDYDEATTGAKSLEVVRRATRLSSRRTAADYGLPSDAAKLGSQERIDAWGAVSFEGTYVGAHVCADIETATYDGKTVYVYTREWFFQANASGIRGKIVNYATDGRDTRGTINKGSGAGVQSGAGVYMTSGGRESFLGYVDVVRSRESEFLTRSTQSQLYAANGGAAGVVVTIK